jgi:hypothetical protein
MFGCAYYPNLSVKAAHKLTPRSTRCVFLRYSDHKDHQWLDLTTTNIVISQHVVSYEAGFPFFDSPRLTNDLNIFLQDDSPSAAPMPAPLPVPHIPSGFLLLVTTGDRTARLGGQTPLRTEAHGMTASPSAQTTLGTEFDGLTITPSG